MLDANEGLYRTFVNTYDFDKVGMITNSPITSTLPAQRAVSDDSSLDEKPALEKHMEGMTPSISWPYMH